MSSNSNNISRIPILPPMVGTPAWYESQIRDLEERLRASNSTYEELKDLSIRAIDVSNQKFFTLENEIKRLRIILESRDKKINQLRNDYDFVVKALANAEDKVEDLSTINLDLGDKVLALQNKKRKIYEIKNPYRQIRKRNTSEFSRLF